MSQKEDIPLNWNFQQISAIGRPIHRQNFRSQCCPSISLYISYDGLKFQRNYYNSIGKTYEHGYGIYLTHVVRIQKWFDSCIGFLISQVFYHVTISQKQLQWSVVQNCYQLRNIHHPVYLLPNSGQS